MWLWILALCEEGSSKSQTNRSWIFCQKDIIFLPMHLCFWKRGSVVKQGHLIYSVFWNLGLMCLEIFESFKEEMIFSCYVIPPPLPAIQFPSFLWLTVKILMVLLVGSRLCHAVFIESCCMLGDGNRIPSGVSSVFERTYKLKWERLTSYKQIRTIN